MIRQFLAVLILLVNCMNSYAADAANCTSIKNGKFSETTTWSCGAVPGKSTNVTISHNVDLDVTFTSGNAVKGTWIVDATASLTSTTTNIEFSGTSTCTVNGDFQVYDITFKNGADITFSGSSTVIIHNDLDNVNNSDEIVVNSSNFRVKNDLDNGVNSKIKGLGCISVGGVITNDASAELFDCTGVACNACHSALPIELLQFKAQRENGSVKLNWITGSEINNSLFIVEKSLDGIYFEEVYRVDGAGKSNKEIHYSYIDKDVSTSESIYYRIVDVDFEGYRNSSDVITSKSNTNMDVTILVRPFAIVNNSDVNCTYSITDLSGKTLLNGVIAGQEKYVFDSGSYLNQIVFVKVMDWLTGKQVSKKVFVQE